jgi:hypothetical protein
VNPNTAKVNIPGRTASLMPDNHSAWILAGETPIDELIFGAQHGEQPCQPCSEVDLLAEHGQ